MGFIKIKIKDSFLSELNLPDIEYPIVSEGFSDSFESSDLPYAHMLFGLQNVDTITPEVNRAKFRLAELLAPPNDNREIVTVCGDNWWLELGPIAFDKEMVTIQRKKRLLAAIQPRDDGRLRVSSYTMLDKKSLKSLIGMSLLPHPQCGVCMRENNWEYVKDQSGLIANAYADKRGDSYLSYWQYGLGVIPDNSIIQDRYIQRTLQPIKPQITAVELGIYYMYEELISG